VTSPLVLQVFLTFLRIGLISFGGVVGVLPVLEKMVVVDHAWLTHDAFYESYVLAQFVPGPNVALCPLIGYRIAGWPGFAAGFAGIYTPPLAIMGVTFALYRRYRGHPAVKRAERSLRPLVLGLLASSAVRIYWAQSATTSPSAVALRVVGAVIVLAAFAALRRKLLHPLLVIVLAGGAWWAAAFL
jgi:chromate transporter